MLDTRPAKCDLVTSLHFILLPAFLISESTHYVLPDAQSLVEDIEVYQHPAIAGVIVTQTAAAHVSKV